MLSLLPLNWWYQFDDKCWHWHKVAWGQCFAGYDDVFCHFRRDRPPITIVLTCQPSVSWFNVFLSIRAVDVKASRMTFLSWWIPPLRHPMVLLQCSVQSLYIQKLRSVSSKSAGIYYKQNLCWSLIGFHFNNVMFLLSQVMDRWFLSFQLVWCFKGPPSLPHHMQWGSTKE